MDKTFRCVVVGCGAVSHAWFDYLTKRSDVRVVGLADIVEEQARLVAGRFGLESAVIGTDYCALFDQLKPDFVVDCTIPEVHSDVTYQALRRGCHVFGEKPLAHSMDAARASVAAAQAAGLTYAVMQNRRFDPNIRRYRDFLATGAIGEVTTLHCDFFVAPHFGGFRAIMDHVLLLDMAIHTFDAARLISGADPVAVYCHEWNPKGSWLRHGSSAAAIFEMTGGLVFTYRGSWCGEGCNTTWEADWRAIGTQGTARWDGASDMRAQIVNGKEGFEFACEDVEIPFIPANGDPVGHAGQIHHFLECLKEGRTPETTCTDNIKSLAMVFGAIESAKTGLRVEISL